MEACVANRRGLTLSWLFAGSLLAIPISPLEILPELEATLRPPQEVVVLEPAPSYGVVFHTVKPGESLLLIAARYRSDLGEIKKLSGLKRDLLKPGQTLKVPIEVKQKDEPRLPPGVQVYTVRPGGTGKAFELEPEIRGYDPATGRFERIDERLF